jgi:hypothetical protein
MLPMVRLEKIQSALFPALYDAFLHDDDPLSNEQDWRNVFDYQFDSEHDYCGYAMLDENEVVGMMGMVFSQRTIDDTTVRFCNLHTWWVREDHRGRSLVMLRPILRLDGYTITHFTPCDRIRAITKRMGFRPLSSQLRILLPNRLIWNSRAGRAGARLTFDLDEIRQNTAERDTQILEDHQPYGCGHLWCGSRHEGCYLLYTYVVRHRFPYCHIHYIGDRNAYAKHERAIRSALLERHQARFVAIDTRLIGDLEFPFSFNFWAPAHAIYKSDQLAPHQVDNLYSDVVFLKLTTLPDISHEIREVAKRFWPGAKADPQLQGP